MKILVVVDFQNDFIDGTLGSKEAQNIIPRVAEIVKKHKGPIICTKDTHEKNTYFLSQEGQKLPILHCERGSQGQALEKNVADILKTKNQVKIIEKNQFGTLALVETIKEFKNELSQGELLTVEFLGICTDICVITNILLVKTNFPDMILKVYADATSGSSPAKHKAALQVLESCQVEII